LKIDDSSPRIGTAIVLVLVKKQTALHPSAKAVLTSWLHLEGFLSYEADSFNSLVAVINFSDIDSKVW
jgi:hypothetical protein